MVFSGFLFGTVVTGLIAAPETGVQPPSVEAMRSWYEINPKGVSIQEEHGRAPMPPVTLAATAAGPLWTISDNTWVGKAVSIGELGTQVFTELDVGQDMAECLSGFDNNPPAPVWQSLIQADIQWASVDSADDQPVHVSLHQIQLGTNALQRTAILSRYSSSSSTPTWKYTFPTLMSGPSRVAISRDGKVIVGAILNNFTMKIEIAVLGPNSATPLSYSVLPLGPQFRGFDLSADGSTLYYSSSTTAYVFDVASHSVVYQTSLPGGFECHAISGNGSVFAFGGFNFMDVYERSGGTYSRTYTRSLPGSVVCGRIDISDDSSTIAYGFNYFDTNLVVRVEALDVPSKTVTMTDFAVGLGLYQNVTSDVSISADGQRFAVGLWGDQLGTCPEVRLYTKYESAPVALYDTPGSVLDLDMSADGQRVAVGVKAAHANAFAGGGSIRLYAFEHQDLRAHGIPSVGDTIGFDIVTNPGSPTYLLWSPNPALDQPMLANMGTLYLQRTSITVVPFGTADTGGQTHGNFVLPSAASQIGHTLYFQGLSVAPRHLTDTWIKMTLLP